MTTSLIQQYYEALAEDRFLGNRCRACDRYSFPPTTACEQCGSFDVEPHQMSGKGTLLFASHNLAPPPHPRFADMAPYVYAHVLLEEGCKDIATEVDRGGPCDHHSDRYWL